MKKCIKCHIEKDESEYYGVQTECKECTKERIRSNPKQTYSNDNSYDKTEKGVIRVIYKTQKSNSKRRGHIAPSYTKQELSDFMYLGGYKKKYDTWVDSGYEKSKKPSIDRINNYLGYSIDNIVLVTWGENHKRQSKDIISGSSTGGERCKPTLCFNSDMELIAEYISYSEARRAVGYSFDKMIKSHRPDRKNGYIWYYKEDYQGKA